MSEFLPEYMKSEIDAMTTLRLVERIAECEAQITYATYRLESITGRPYSETVTGMRQLLNQAVDDHVRVPLEECTCGTTDSGWGSHTIECPVRIAREGPR